MTGDWAITDAAVVSPGGDDPASVFDALLEGRPLGGGNGWCPAVPIPEFDPRRYVQRKGLKWLSRTSQLACAAAAGVREGLEGVGRGRVGVVFGTAWASLDSVVRFEREAHREGARFVDPILFTETVGSVPAGQVSIFFGWSALNITVASGTASGLVALERAVQFLEEGRADVVVAGGGDELNEHLLRTLHAEGLVADSGPPAPYAERAPGTVGAEGACLLTVESSEHARSRGARVLGRIVAATSGFVDPRAVAGDRLRAARLGRALEQAGWAPRDVDLLVLSANGNRARDRAEGVAIAELFGAQAPPVVVPKAVLGESWGASGSLGVAIVLEAMRRSSVPGRAAGPPAGPLPPGLNLPVSARRCDVRRALVVDCSESGQLAAVGVASGA